MLEFLLTFADMKCDEPCLYCTLRATTVSQFLNHARQYNYVGDGAKPRYMKERQEELKKERDQQLAAAPPKRKHTVLPTHGTKRTLQTAEFTPEVERRVRTNSSDDLQGLFTLEQDQAMLGDILDPELNSALFDTIFAPILLVKNNPNG